jgi:hypothetical protein
MSIFSGFACKICKVNGLVEESVTLAVAGNLLKLSTQPDPEGRRRAQGTACGARMRTSPGEVFRQSIRR